MLADFSGADAATWLTEVRLPGTVEQADLRPKHVKRSNTLTLQPEIRHRTEVADGMQIEWDVPIEMEDGAILRADIFRPIGEGKFPVLMTLGPYAKGLSFQEGYAGMWNRVAAQYPDALEGSSNKYQVWETVDPEKWVPDGYVCVRIDSRGAGRSAGCLDMWGPQEAKDYYDSIEWAAVQPWSSGRVGLLGISYFGINQWLVAALRPPHLVAICPWEGYTDLYRDGSRHGGILTRFGPVWAEHQIYTVQHGVGERGARSQVTGELVAGPPTLDAHELEKNRVPTVDLMRSKELIDDFYIERSAQLEKIDVPVLSAANWGHHLHTRGNFEGFNRVGSEQKWLEVHGHEHYAEFYTNYGVTLQKRFFGHFLKDEDTGWETQPNVRLNVRHVDGSFEGRDEDEWPLARTQWTKFYLDAANGTLSTSVPSQSAAIDFEGLGAGATFWTEPLREQLEITGPSVARLRIASNTTDADLFVTLRVQDLEGKDVTLVSAIDPHGVLAVGWLRASHREVDEELSLPYRPWHPHKRKLPLTPGEPVDADVEIWPTSLIIPAGFRLGVTVSGSDFEIPGDGPWPELYGIPLRGNGVFIHNIPEDRPAETFDNLMTLHTGPTESTALLLPVIPQ